MYIYLYLHYSFRIPIGDYSRLITRENGGKTAEKRAKHPKDKLKNNGKGAFVNL